MKLFKKRAKKEKKPKKKLTKKQKIIRGILIGVGSVLLVAIVWLAAVYFGVDLRKDDKVDGYVASGLVDENGNEIEIVRGNKKKVKGIYNFIVGCTDKGGTRTDTLMLVNFNTIESTISVLNIPRDTYISTTANAKKINSCYAIGKSEELVSKVQDTFGIYVDNYVIMNIDTFKNVVDEMGGVEVDVQFDMIYDDPAQDLHINIKKGKQTLMGEDAEGFVRYRKGYASADLDRVKAQRVFMAAAAKKMTSAACIAKLPQIISVACDGIKTDLTKTKILSFVKQAVKFDFDDIKMYDLPGQSQMKNHVSYYTMYRDATIALMNEAFNSYTDDITADECAIIELAENPNADVDIVGHTLTDIEASTPPKKTVNFNNSSSTNPTVSSEITNEVNQEQVEEPLEVEPEIEVLDPDVSKTEQQTPQQDQQTSQQEPQETQTPTEPSTEPSTEPITTTTASETETTTTPSTGE